jgi:hypothetical protein
MTRGVCSAAFSRDGVGVRARACLHGRHEGEHLAQRAQQVTTQPALQLAPAPTAAAGSGHGSGSCGRAAQWVGRGGRCQAAQQAASSGFAAAEGAAARGAAV